MAAREEQNSQKQQNALIKWLIAWLAKIFGVKLDRDNP